MTDTTPDQGDERTLTTEQQAKEARRIFVYDPATGIVTWAVNRGHRRAGQPVGTVHHNGCMVVRFLNKFHRLHRVIWLHQYGVWPMGEVDHINGNPLDNRLSNLRDVTTAQNQWNRHKPKGAAFWNRKLQKWCVHLKVNGKLMYFGCYADEQKAREVGATAIKEHHGEFARH